MTTPNAVGPKQVASSAVIVPVPSICASAGKVEQGQAQTRLAVEKPCNILGTSTTAVVLICKTEESWLQKGLLTAPSLLTSLAAVLLSWSALRYNRTKDQSARKQSISDDFWLRKVVSPVAIEPFLKFVISLSAVLPSATSTPDDTTKFWTATTSSFNEFTASFFNLELISTELHKEVEKLLEGMEDALSNYCGTLQQYFNDPALPIPDRAEVLVSLGKTSRNVMQEIARFQANVGTD